MKIALLSTADSGGAGKATLRLNKALNLIGEDSDLIVKWKSIDDDRIIQINSNEVNNIVFDSLTIKYFFTNIKPGNTTSSIMYPSIGFEFLKALVRYDIVNLHWISSFISIEAIMKVRNMGKPIVWTLHDQNPFTGACHYTHGCDKFKVDCNECPQLVRNEFNITKHILDSKFKHLPKDITIVTPSRWLADCAKESKVFGSNRIEVIPNSIETDIYKPSDRESVKKTLGLSESTKVVLFGAFDLNEKRKGLLYLIEAMQYCKQNSFFKNLVEKNEICILTFGNP